MIRTLLFWTAALTCAALAPAADPPPLDLNTATVEELDRLPGIGPGRAETIVRFRENTGGFRCVEELLAVPQLPEKVYEEIRDRVIAGGPFARPEACRPPSDTEPASQR